MRQVRVLVDPIRERRRRRIGRRGSGIRIGDRHQHVTEAVRRRLEVLDQIACSAVHVRAFGVSAAVPQVGAVRRGELVRQRRLQTGRHERVGERRVEDERAGQRIVRQVEAGREAAALAGRPGVREIDVGRIAHRAVRDNLRFVVPAGVLTVGEVNDVIAVAVDVPGRRERAARCGCCRC